MGFVIKGYLTKINFESFKSIFLQNYDPFSPGYYLREIKENLITWNWMQYLTTSRDLFLLFLELFSKIMKKITTLYSMLETDRIGKDNVNGTLVCSILEKWANNLKC